MVRLLPVAGFALIPPNSLFSVVAAAAPLLHLTDSLRLTEPLTVAEQTKAAAQTTTSMSVPVTPSRFRPPSIPPSLTSFPVPIPSLISSSAISSSSVTSSSAIPSSAVPSSAVSSFSAASSSSPITPASATPSTSLTSSRSEALTTPKSSLSSSSSPPPPPPSTSRARTSSTRPAAVLADTSIQSSISTTISTPIPQTTLVLTNALVPSLTSSTVAPPATSSGSSAQPLSDTGSSFWNNKAAVGGVFAVVGLVIVGVLVVLAVNLVKRVNKSRAARIDRELFDNTYPESMRPGPSPPPMSLNDPPVDPFAADEVRQVGGAASLGMTGYGHSEEGHAASSSHGHSSHHHGFSGVPFSAAGPGLQTMHENPFEDKSSYNSSGYDDYYLHGHSQAPPPTPKLPSMGADSHYMKTLAVPAVPLSAKSSSAYTFDRSTTSTQRTGTSGSAYSNHSPGISPGRPEAVSGYAL